VGLENPDTRKFFGLVFHLTGFETLLLQPVFHVRLISKSFIRWRYFFSLCILILRENLGNDTRQRGTKQSVIILQLKEWVEVGQSSHTEYNFPLLLKVVKQLLKLTEVFSISSMRVLSDLLRDSIASVILAKR